MWKLTCMQTYAFSVAAYTVAGMGDMSRTATVTTASNGDDSNICQSFITIIHANINIYLPRSAIVRTLC